MSLQLNQVKKIAKLANLSIDDSEATKLEDQLNKSLKYISNLDEIDTTNVPPTEQVSGLYNVMRSDEVSDSLTQEQALQNASSQEGGYFKVKAVFENET